MHDLGRDEHDAECDARLDGGAGQVDETECRTGQGEAMSECECGHRDDQTPRVPDQNEQCKNEHQVIDAVHDVLEAEPEIGSYDLETARQARNHER